MSVYTQGLFTLTTTPNITSICTMLKRDWSVQAQGSWAGGSIWSLRAERPCARCSGKVPSLAASLAPQEPPLLADPGSKYHAMIYWIYLNAWLLANHNFLLNDCTWPPSHRSSISLRLALSTRTTSSNLAHFLVYLSGISGENRALDLDNSWVNKDTSCSPASAEMSCQLLHI